MGIFKELAENLYLVGLLDKDGVYHVSEFFGNSEVFVREYLEEIGFRVVSIEKLEGDN